MCLKEYAQISKRCLKHVSRNNPQNTYKNTCNSVTHPMYVITYLQTFLNFNNKRITSSSNFTLVSRDQFLDQSQTLTFKKHNYVPIMNKSINLVPNIIQYLLYNSSKFHCLEHPIKRYIAKMTYLVEFWIILESELVEHATHGIFYIQI